MRYSSIPSAQSVVQHCKTKGIKHIVISPGSRNAPLTICFSEDPYFNCYSIVDERCAGFFALGMAQQLKEPVVVLCTSGSALLNYYPAVSEAFFSDIPLIVISADRPVYKIDVGDGQTIRQDHVFERHIGYSANLKQDVTHATDRIEKYVPQWLYKDDIDNVQKRVATYNDQTLNKAINMALASKIPVHINVPFEEPLYDFKDKLTATPNFIFNKKEDSALPSELDEYVDIWNASKRKMVLVGVNDPDTIAPELLDRFGNDPSVVVLTETTSNLHHPNFFPSIDSIIAPIEKQSNNKALFEKLRPDVLLTFGGLIVSKKIKAFLREYNPEHHWHIDSKKALNTFFCLSHHFKCEVNSVLEKLMFDNKGVQSSYFSDWDILKSLYKDARKQYLKQIPFSDMLAFQNIIKNIPNNYQLQLANSSTVRYAQLFDLDASLKVFCNRGTSGIDGSTSTAVGASIHNQTPTVLITGDLSFFYDSNGLWNNYIRPDFRIILINNQGGGIFRILPGKEDTSNFENYFETTHNLDAEKLCQMYGIGYRLVSDIKKLQEANESFYLKSDKPQLLEINTPRLLNNKILMGYFDFISSEDRNH